MPAAPTTRQPITQSELIQALEQDVSARGIVITREACAVARPGQVLYGSFDLHWEPIGAWGCAVVFRYAPEESDTYQPTYIVGGTNRD